jgi:hypothetical protein
VNAGASANYLATLTPVINSNPSTTITWSVSGSGCIGAACGTISANGAAATYQAPAVLPTPNTVTISATPLADPAKAAAMVVTINGAAASVIVAPASASLGIGGTQLFAAQVTGPSNTAVTWDVNGVVGGNSTVGTISVTTGTNAALYSAPSALPSPPTAVVHATSNANPTAVGESIITLTMAPAISALLPASVFAGGAGGFTLSVQGADFVASSPGPGSTILVGGTARTTDCTSSDICTTSLTAADIAVAGTLSVQIENPGSIVSNIVTFVVAPAPAASGVISLTPANPVVTGQNITVVDPSTAGSTTPQADVTIAVAAMGIFSATENSCTLGAGAIPIVPPASGTVVVNICAFSISGLDPSFTYAITGPPLPDIVITGAQPLGLGIVQLTLSVPSTAQPGLRSLFVTNANKDTAVATGVLEVQ